MYIECLDMDEGEFMVNLEGASIEDLKAIARCASRWINKVLYDMPMYGIDRQTEPLNADWEHQSDWTIIDDVITIDDVNRTKKYLMKQELEVWTTKMSCVDINWVTPIQLDNLPCCPPPTTATITRYGTKASVNQITKEQDMYNEVQEAKRHLNTRLTDIYFTMENKLVPLFNMQDARPKSVKQAKDWLARGGMTLNNHQDDEDSRYFNVQWQDPDKPRNEEGYKAAQFLLGKDYQAAKDAILVQTPQDGLKALQEFEAKTYN